MAEVQKNNVHEPRQRGPLPVIAIAIGFSVVAGLAAYANCYRHLPDGLYGLIDQFGPLAESIVKHHRYAAVEMGIPFTAHRMPLLPLYLAAIGSIANQPLLAVLVKAVICGTLVGFALWRLRTACAGVSATVAHAAAESAALPQTSL